MIAVIFEVELKSDGKVEYLEIAAEPKTLLVEMQGFMALWDLPWLPTTCSVSRSFQKTCSFL